MQLPQPHHNNSQKIEASQIEASQSIDGGELPATYLYVLVALVSFMLAAAVTSGVQHWGTISALFYETHLAKYEVMTGDRGPTTYLVFHKNLEALKALANEHDDILGVEQSEFSSVAKMAFQSAQSPLIKVVSEHPSVTNMVNRNVPMICH